MSDDQAEEVVLYDTQGFQDPAQWKRITNREHTFTNSEHVVFENGSFRVTYPFLKDGQRAGHSYWLKMDAEWRRVTGLEYGDYTYFIDSIWYPPEDITILKNTPEEVEIAFRYSHKNYRAATSIKEAYKGDMILTKIMSLKKGYSGVFVTLNSRPVNPYGEREIGFGISAPLIYSDKVESLHPLAGYHVPLVMHKAQWYYAVSLPIDDSFYRILALSRPMIALAYQPKDRTRGGRVIVSRLVEQRADKYQVFLGARPYDSSKAILEVESQIPPEALVYDEDTSGGQYARLTADTAQRQVLTITSPVSGEYRLVFRGRAPSGGQLQIQVDEQPVKRFEVPASKRFAYHRVYERQELSAGEHQLAIKRESGDIDIDTVLMLPIISPQKDFPLDVFTRVFPEMILAESRFEAERLRQNTGRNVPDQDASNGFAKLARADKDRSDFMTFGPYQRVIEPGKYVATFSVKVSDNTVDEMVAVLDVHSVGVGAMSRKMLKGTDFKNPLEYQSFDLEFTIQDMYPPKIHRLEFRVAFSGATDVWVDCVDLAHTQPPVID